VIAAKLIHTHKQYQQSAFEADVEKPTLLGGRKSSNKVPH